ncbi:hypothetical protein [Streptomyces flavidovirens]|uniref:hypothetical protein n=1 Tax=Streptomyces flavidovirens TaxID=67298 RepID=UPI00040C5A09|nr:hypothetical protein [Streptomyces flavidovirens]
MRSPHHHIADEGAAGPVTITLDTAMGRVEVSGPGIPTALLMRTDGDPADSRRPDSRRADGVTPVGTRSAHRLSLTVGDTTALLVPARGHLSRRSYRVDASVGDVTYRLVPHTLGESRLLRDGARLGAFQADGDAGVIAVWAEDTVPDPDDISVGYALAAAFGTGAQHFLAALVDVGAEALPW